MNPRYAFLDHPGPIAFAHRGGGLENPENTLAAFQHAVDLGFRYLETDARVTLDGRLVAFHDPDLARVTDRAGLLGELTWGEVSKARIRTPDGDLSDQSPVLLEELLATFPDARFNIDAKEDRAVAPLLDLVERFGALDRVCIASFSPSRIKAARNALGPDLCTALGSAEIASVKLGRLGRVARPARAVAAQVPVTRAVGPIPVPVITAGFVRRAHALGLVVHAWTIDRSGEMRRLLDLGVDGIMTDRPSVLRKVLDSRGQWAVNGPVEDSVPPERSP